MIVRIPKCQASKRSGLMSRMPTRTRRGVQSVEIQPMWKAFSVLQKSPNVKLVTSLDTLPAFVIRKSKLHSRQRNQRHINYKQGPVYAKESAICGQSEDSSSSKDSFCLQIKVQCTQANIQKIPKPAHLIANLAYRLKSCHTRNLYLRARLYTCADVNIMSASVYRLVFKDPEMKKLAPSSLETGTYTTDTVKTVGCCMFQSFHLDTKKWMDVTFFAAVNDGSVLLSCKTTLNAWGWYNQEQDWTSCHPELGLNNQAQLITPRKLKLHCVYRRRKCPLNDLYMKWPLKCQDRQYAVPKLVTSKEQKLCELSRYLWNYWQLPRSLISYTDWSKCYPQANSLSTQFLSTLKKHLNKKLAICYKPGVLKPVHEATPWINSFVLVESKDKSGNLKLCICLNPANLNKAIIREPYHFRTLRTFPICLQIPA